MSGREKLIDIINIFLGCDAALDGRLARGWNSIKTLSTPILTNGGKVRES